MSEEAKKGLNRIELRPGVFIEPGTYYTSSVKRIAEETQIEPRGALVDVQQAFGGALIYKNKSGEEQTADICLQVGEVQGIPQLFISCASGTGAFNHYAISMKHLLNENDRREAYRPLAFNLEMVAQNLVGNGVELQDGQFVADIMSLLPGGRNKLFSP